MLKLGILTPFVVISVSSTKSVLGSHEEDLKASDKASAGLEEEVTVQFKQWVFEQRHSLHRACKRLASQQSPTLVNRHESQISVSSLPNVWL